MRYKITCLTNRNISIKGKGLTKGESIILDKPIDGYGIKCEKIEDKKKNKLKKEEE